MDLADSLTLKAMVEFREVCNSACLGKLNAGGGGGAVGLSGSNSCFSTCRFWGRMK